MYEFTKKEIRKKFKETEYGKKTNRWLLLSFVVAFVSYVICTCLCVLANGENVELSSSSEILLTLLKIITFLSIISMCYFDGKRDGAIEQFKKDNK